MSVPDQIRQELKAKLWKIADQVGWLTLSATEKSRHYEDWTRDPDVGGLVARYIPLGDVRVYVKDTLLKDFARFRLADEGMPCRVLRVSATIEVARNYVKPHGRQLKDGRIICWGRATAWKTILMAAYERAYSQGGLKPYGVALTHAVGRYKEVSSSRTRVGEFGVTM
jgi:hypothetical protein